MVEYSIVWPAIDIELFLKAFEVFMTDKICYSQMVGQRCVLSIKNIGVSFLNLSSP